MLEKVNLINKLNQKEENNFVLYTKNIYEATKDANIHKKDMIEKDLMKREGIINEENKEI